MNAITRMSAKGQVVVPAAMRQRLGWASGLDLEVIEHDDGIILRQRGPAKSLTPNQAVKEFRKLYQHEGPPVSLEDMNASARRMATGEDTFES